MVSPKAPISTNCIQHNIGCSSLNTDSHFNHTNPKNKDLMVIPNHVQRATFVPVESKETFKSIKNITDTSKVKESLMVTKKDKQILEQTSQKPELLLNTDIFEKSKLSDNINDISAFPFK